MFEASVAPVGPALADRMAGLRLDAVDEDELIDALTAAERLARWATAAQLAVLNELLGRRGDPQYVTDEIAVELRLSRVAAAARVGLALDTQRLPQLATGIAAGQLDVPKAAAIAEAVTVLDDPVRTHVTTQAVERATRHTVGELRAWLRRTVLAADPAAAQRRHTQLCADRRVIVTPVGDGMAELWALLPADDAARIYTVLTACAHATMSRFDAGGTQPVDPAPDGAGCGNRGSGRHATPPSVDLHRSESPCPTPPSGDPGSHRQHTKARRANPDTTDLHSQSHPHHTDLDGTRSDRTRSDGGDRGGGSGDARTADQRRADALVDLVTGRRTAPTGPTALVRLAVPLATLVGAADHPGDLPGLGPIPAAMARQLAADGLWRWLATDPAGTIVDAGRRSYRPPAALAALIRGRDQRCRFPGCRQPAHRCDLDHTIPYPQGPTTRGNLTAICRHHHQLKQRPDWAVEQHSNADLTWTTPTGKVHTTSPPRHLSAGCSAGDAPPGQAGSHPTHAA